MSNPAQPRPHVLTSRDDAPPVGSPWWAPGAWVLAAGSAWTVGAWMQGRHLLIGLVLTEVFCFAAPAALVLAWRGDAGRRGTFRPVAPGAVWLTLLLAALVVTAAVAQGLAVRRVLGMPPPNAWLPLPLWLIIALLAPVCEELLFRPVLQDGLARVWRPAPSVLATALLFGLIHGSAARFSETFLLGLFCGVVFLKTGSYWSCVVFHALANTLGPALYARADAVPWLLHPVAAAVCLVAAVWLSGRLGKPESAESRRLPWWRWPGQQLFGGGRLPARRGGASAPFTAAYLVVAAVAAGLVGLTLRGAGPAGGERGRPFVAREQDTWVLHADETLAGASRIEAETWPPADQPLRLNLPYPEARLVAIHQDGHELRWRMLSFTAFEVRQLAAEGGKARGPLVVEWETPLDVLFEPKRGYRAHLQALLPVSAYQVDLLLQPGGRWVLAGRPGEYRTTLFSIESTGGRPRLEFGSCGLGITEAIPREGADPVP